MSGSAFSPTTQFSKEIEIFNVVIFVCVSIVLFIFSSWLWKRRGQYALSLKLPGPHSYPFVGSLGVALSITSDGGLIAEVLKMLKTYPPLCRFWLGPQLVIPITKPEDVENLLKCETLLAKPPTFCDIWTKSLGNGLLTSSATNSTWKSHRDILSSSFSGSAMKYQQEVIQNYCAFITRALKPVSTGRQVNFDKYVSRMCADIMTETLFDYTYDFWEGKRDDIVRAPEIICQSTHTRMTKFWLWFKPIYNLTYGCELQERFSGLFRKFVEDIYVLKKKEYLYKATGTDKNNCKQDDLAGKILIELLLDADVNRKMAHDEIIEEMMNTWIVGMETTSVVTSTTILMLAIHKDAQEKAWMEIKEFYKDNRDAPVKLEDLAHFHYLENCIKEVERLFPVASIQMRYTTEPLILNSRNISIPPGTSVAMFSYLSHRDPEVWEDPDIFHPERFSPDKVAKRHPYAFYPFSGGPRSCIGQKFGHNVIKTLMVYVLRNYELYCNWKLADIPLKTGINVRTEWGYKASFIQRNWEKL